MTIFKLGLSILLYWFFLKIKTFLPLQIYKYLKLENTRNYAKFNNLMIGVSTLLPTTQKLSDPTITVPKFNAEGVFNPLPLLYVKSFKKWHQKIQFWKSFLLMGSKVKIGWKTINIWRSWCCRFFTLSLNVARVKFKFYEGF